MSGQVPDRGTGTSLDSPCPEVRSAVADRYVGLGHEGMVTVWDDEGRYLGCMGIETWKRLLSDAARAE